jgi:hypothetical protein
MMITLKDYLTSSGKYPEREKFADEQVINNATLLLEKLNAWFQELGVDVSKLVISSGYRPQEINKKVKGAAKMSGHVIGKSCDFVDDKEQTLAKLALSKPELLKKYDLWIEDPDFTKGTWTNWLHADIVQRSSRPVNVFKP